MKQCESCEQSRGLDDEIWCGEGYNEPANNNECPYFQEKKIKLSGAELRLCGGGL